MPRRSVLPGFRFDGKSGRAFFEVTLPGTGGRRRKRRMVAVTTRDEALTPFREFRAAALAKRAADPKLFSEFIALFWPLIKMRLGAKTATRESYVVKKILEPFLGSYRLDKINTALIRDFAKPLSWTTIQRYFEIAKGVAGVTRRFRFHDLRHTFGSTLASRGVSLQVIAKALGHASVRMSERYARPSQESL